MSGTTSATMNNTKENNRNAGNTTGGNKNSWEEIKVFLEKFSKSLPERQSIHFLKQ
jgi:hypothetical protein